MMKTRTKKKLKVLMNPPPFSLWSLPYDITLNCLARIPRIYHPQLSLVSKDFKSLLASADLNATRSHIGTTQDCLYVCLNNLSTKPNPPLWFTFGPTLERKLIPIPPCPYTYPQSSTVLSVGSEIYIIGGLFGKKRTRSVFVLDCLSHQWHKLPKMRVHRKSPVADVIDGKIYVLGGTKSKKARDWGECYDTKTRTWEKISRKKLDLTMQKNVVKGRLVMGGNVYAIMNYGLNRYMRKKNTCMVEIDENVMCQICVSNAGLWWRIAKEDLTWRRVRGYDQELSSAGSYGLYLNSVTRGGRRRVLVWWKFMHLSPWTTKIWCAEISFRRHGSGELHGSVEWCENVFTYLSRDDDAYCLGSDFLLHSAIVKT